MSKNSLSKLVVCMMTAAIFLAASGRAIAFQVGTINENDLRRHVNFMASEEMQGRDTPSKELKIAARYIASAIESYGLKPLLANGSYYQKIYYENAKVSENGTVMTLTSKSGEKRFAFPADFSANLRYEGTHSGEIVFAGLGISSPDIGWDDLKDIDVKGKMVVVLDGSVLPANHEARKYLRERLGVLYRKGAAGMLTVLSPDNNNKMSSANETFPVRETKRLKGLSSPFLLFSGSIKHDVARSILGNLPQSDIDAFYSKLAEGKQVRARTISGSRVVVQVKRDAESLEEYTSNIIAFREGSDPKLKNEFVGYGAHYDHVGVRGGQIYYGADDNASGTSTLLEIAEAFSKINTRRSIYFIWFTAEEKGLLGSKYFAESNVIPLENMSALFNFDMVGRLAADSLYIVGSNMLSSELHEINERVNKEQIKLGFNHSHNTKDDPEQWYYRSDHYNLSRYGVPAIFYTGPDHPDYHKPTDTADKINFATMAKIAKLSFLVGEEIANKRDLLKLDMDPKITSRGKHNSGN